jgi:hypothetical protein
VRACLIEELAVKWWRCWFSWVVRSAGPWWYCLYRLESIKKTCWIWKELQTGVAFHSFTHMDAIGQNYEYLSNQRSLKFLLPSPLSTHRNSHAWIASFNQDKPILSKELDRALVLGVLKLISLLILGP